MSKLKPCPFCDCSKSGFVELPKRGWDVRCGDCPASNFGRTKEQAAEGWNERPLENELRTILSQWKSGTPAPEAMLAISQLVEGE